MLSLAAGDAKRGLLRAFAIGRPLRMFRLARRQPFERILGWDIDTAGRRLAVVGPAATELHLLDAMRARALRDFTIPSVANTDPRFSLLKFLDDNRLCWVTRGEPSGLFDLMIMDLSNPTQPQRRPIGRMTVRALEAYQGQAFVLTQEHGVLRIDPDGQGDPAPLTSEGAVAFVHAWSGDLHIVETRRSPEDVASGDLARIEAGRRPVLRPVEAGQIAEAVIPLPSAPSSSVIAGLPGGWAILAGPPLMADQGAGARIVIAGPQGEFVSERPIAPAGAQPAAIVCDGRNVYATFVQSDQPLRALELETGEIASTRIKSGALSLRLRPRGLFFQNSDLVGAFLG